MKISVVIPCYYSEKVIADVVSQTRAELVASGYDYEFVLVNDGSRDKTFQAIEKLCEEDTRIKGIDLMRNFGQHNAIMAGLHETTGDAVLLMDDDMQTHPSQCLALIKGLEDGVDVVFAKFHIHKESLFRRCGSWFAMFTIRVLAGCPKGITDSNFLVMRACVRDEMLYYASSSVYIQGLIFRTTDRMVNVEVEHFDRQEGDSGYTLKSLLRLWSTILNFSVTPLRIASVLGVLMGGVGLIGAISLFIERLFDPSMQLGWASTMVAILVCSGVILVFMGFLGEYVGRLFMTVNKNPQFIVRTRRQCASLDKAGESAVGSCACSGESSSGDRVPCPTKDAMFDNQPVPFDDEGCIDAAN
ncbi:MAG: glycosyltransferase family 2 protein [Gordonibacter sp.]